MYLCTCVCVSFTNGWPRTFWRKCPNPSEHLYSNLGLHGIFSKTLWLIHWQSIRSCCCYNPELVFHCWILYLLFKFWWAHVIPPTPNSLRVGSNVIPLADKASTNHLFWGTGVGTGSLGWQEVQKHKQIMIEQYVKCYQGSKPRGLWELLVQRRSSLVFTDRSWTATDAAIWIRSQHESPETGVLCFSHARPRWALDFGLLPFLTQCSVTSGGHRKKYRMKKPFLSS